MEKQKWFVPGIKIAFAYVGTVIGAGFASGQEILRFFTLYGVKALWAILLSTFLFIWVARKILLLGGRLRLKSFRGLIENYFGFFAPFVNGYLMFAMLVIGTAMFAGAGALFAEHLKVPFEAGVLVTAAAALVTILFGLRGVLWVNALVVPLILFFNVFILAYTFTNQTHIIIHAQSLPPTPVALIKAGISYASFNLLLSIGVLSPMGSEIENSKALTFGGVLGGCILGIMLMIGHLSLWMNTPEIYDYEIPMLYIVQRIGSLFFGIYALILWGGIFTTVIGNLYSLGTIAEDMLRIPPLYVSLIIIGLAVVFSRLGFSYIVKWVYPLLGLIGFLLVGVIMIPGKRGIKRYKGG